ncbi:helix-turn-helix domain-containing protein [Sphingomonas sp. NFX23]|uniref:helix-turn-helix domain-containing protein n=1 Tax=Sphingomonas sp. NFX23 TaxID=2819532 RepID=UPI003CF47653
MKLQIAELRRKRGITQGELAKKVGATQSMIGKLERGEREMTFSWLQRIAAVLDVATGELFDASDDVVQIGHLDDKSAIIPLDYNAWKEQWELPAGATAFEVTSFSKKAPNSVQTLTDMTVRIPAQAEIVFDSKGKPPKREMLDRLAVVWITEADLSVTQAYVPYVGYLMPGTKPQHYHIIRLIGPALEDARVHFVSLVREIRLP